MIAIKAFNMPDTCIECPMIRLGEQGSWDYCNYMYHKKYSFHDKYAFQAEKQTERPKFCPLRYVTLRKEKGYE